MAETPDSNGSPGDWRDLSRQYWAAWADATRKAFGAGAAGAKAPQGPWHEGLEQWSRMFDAGRASEAQSEVVERLLGGARSYFSLLESLAGKGDAGKIDPHAWTDTLRESFNFPGADAALFDNPLARALRELTGQGAKGFEQMMQAFEPAMAEARALLQLPAFGYAREHQEHYQRVATGWLDYQRETNRYNVLIARASRKAFEVFEDKLAERGESGSPIDSVRGLYDLWVDAAEDAYAEVALSDEFREVYGALVNAQMRVRQSVQREVERVATDLGMPTRTEIDSMGKRLHDVRREVRVQAGQLSAMREELAALREEVAGLRQPRGGAAPRTGGGKSSNKMPAKPPGRSSRRAPRKARKSTGKEKG
ncbi:MAG TPA: class III poly(R)-hydroxyalkanoic acid synthase subunit PhaE [Rhodanobacteraceae bacterium]|nr:class III poly(R)-hydroxyalkanoic acid synthase subunit PhaE [Rhodanobacteraceae bacterium]